MPPTVMAATISRETNHGRSPPRWHAVQVIGTRCSTGFHLFSSNRRELNTNTTASLRSRQNINGVTYDVRRLTVAVNERAVESATGRGLLARGERDNPRTVVSALFASMFDDYTMEWFSRRG